MMRLRLSLKRRLTSVPSKDASSYLLRQDLHTIYWYQLVEIRLFLSNANHTIWVWPSKETQRSFQELKTYPKCVLSRARKFQDPIQRQENIMTSTSTHYDMEAV
jgi:hypothetical protein